MLQQCVRRAGWRRPVRTAQCDYRSIANLIEVLIREHCETNGISIPEQYGLFGEASDEWKNPESFDRGRRWTPEQRGLRL